MTKGQWYGTVGNFKNKCFCLAAFAHVTVISAEGVSLPEKALAGPLCPHLALNAASLSTIMPKSWYIFSFFWLLIWVLWTVVSTFHKQRNYRLFPQLKWKIVGRKYSKGQTLAFHVPQCTREDLKSHTPLESVYSPYCQHLSISARLYLEPQY